MDSNERKIVQELVTALGCVIPASDGYEPKTNLWNKYSAAKNLLAAAPQVVADERESDSSIHPFSWTASRLKGIKEAAPVQAQEPFMYGIMAPDGTAHIDENCVAGSKDSTALHIEVNCLNDSPDTGYSIVPLFRAPVQPVAAPDEKYGRLTGDNEAQPTQVKGDSQ